MPLDDQLQNPTNTRLADLEARIAKLEAMLAPGRLGAAITDAIRKAYEDARQRKDHGDDLTH